MRRRPKIAVDISQFTQEPAASGIQRLLWGVARHWPSDADPLFVYSSRDDKLFRSAPAAVIADVIGGLFSVRSERSGFHKTVDEHLAEHSTPPESLDQILQQVDTWLLPEVTHNIQILRNLSRVQERGVPLAAIFFDAFPETHPHVIPQGQQYGDIARYFRRVALADVTVAISEYADQVLHERLGRSRELPHYVSSPGADHVVARKSPVPDKVQFAVVGSLETRKRHDLVIEGLVNSGLTQARLVLAGRATRTCGPILEKISEARSQGYEVEWLDSPSDAEIQGLYDQSTCVFSCGDEGYGIPVLESIRQGCPVAYFGIQPSAELCEGVGATRILDASSSGIADWMRLMSDPGEAAEKRHEIDLTRMPTWDSFTKGVINPILANLNC